MYSHRYGLDYIGHTGVADRIQGLASLRQKLHNGVGENTRSGAAADGFFSALRRSDTGVLQNVRGGSQVRFRSFFPQHDD